MTPQQRAEKIASEFSERDFREMYEWRLRELLIEKIAAQIEEAEREALKHVDYLPCEHTRFKDGLWCWPCVEALEQEAAIKGFAAAREKAAGMAKDHLGHEDSECSDPHCAVERIRAMEAG